MSGWITSVLANLLLWCIAAAWFRARHPREALTNFFSATLVALLPLLADLLLTQAFRGAVAIAGML